MVQAHYLTPESIIRAMNVGSFYASSGVELSSIDFDQEKKRLTIRIKDDGDSDFTTQFIGTRKAASQDPQDAPFVGEVLTTVKGRFAIYDLGGDELYGRACITSSRDHQNPSFEGQKAQAWTQPIGWSLSAKP